MKKAISLLTLPLFAFVLASCTDDRSDLEKAADKVSDTVEKVGEDVKEVIERNY